MALLTFLKVLWREGWVGSQKEIWWTCWGTRTKLLDYSILLTEAAYNFNNLSAPKQNVRIESIRTRKVLSVLCWIVPKKPWDKYLWKAVVHKFGFISREVMRFLNEKRFATSFQIVLNSISKWQNSIVPLLREPSSVVKSFYFTT